MGDVVSITTGQPVPPANSRVIEILEQWLRLARFGRVTGLAISIATPAGPEFELALPPTAAHVDDVLSGVLILQSRLAMACETGDILFGP